MSLMSPPPALCNLPSHTVVKLCNLDVCFRGELGYLNCDDIIIIITYSSIALISSSIRTFSVRCIKGNVFNKC